MPCLNFSQHERQAKEARTFTKANPSWACAHAPKMEEACKGNSPGGSQKSRREVGSQGVSPWFPSWLLLGECQEVADSHSAARCAAPRDRKLNLKLLFLLTRTRETVCASVEEIAGNLIPSNLFTFLFIFVDKIPPKYVIIERTKKNRH